MEGHVISGQMYPHRSFNLLAFRKAYILSLSFLLHSPKKNGWWDAVSVDCIPNLTHVLNHTGAGCTLVSDYQFLPPIQARRHHMNYGWQLLARVLG